MSKIDSDNLQIIVDSINSGSCILFLGPCFATNKANEKVHKLFRKYLEDERYDMDEGFDNLYILKDPAPKPIPISRMKIKFDEFYENVIPGEVYNLICSIRFKAIISCSHDLFLRKAFKDRWQRIPNFKYFSSKGESVLGDDVGNTQLPLFFNVFGSIADKDSLVITYDSFYEFIMTLISDTKIIPQALKTALNNASVLIFLGFNLDKWYMPLLFRKLKEYIGPRKATNNFVAYATTEDTESSVSAMSIQYYLKHFAIEINGLELDSATFISELFNEKKTHLLLNPETDFERITLFEKELTTKERELFSNNLKNVQDMVTAAELEEGIDLLKRTFRKVEDEYKQALNFQTQLSIITRNYYNTSDIQKKSEDKLKLSKTVIEYCLNKSREIASITENVLQ